MRLRVLTTAFIVVAFTLMCLYPFALDRRPNRHAPRSVRLIYVQKMLALNTGMLFSFSGAAICAVVIVRKARQEYRAQAEQNLRMLIEGTIADQQRKKAP